VKGIALLDLITVVGDTVARYGIEAIFKGIYTERSKKESVSSPQKNSRFTHYRGDKIEAEKSTQHRNNY
jgi:hypothetical protein